MGLNVASQGHLKYELFDFSRFNSPRDTTRSAASATTEIPWSNGHGSNRRCNGHLSPSYGFRIFFILSNLLGSNN